MLRSAVLAVLMVLSSESIAQDLYGAPPPADATYVRVIDAGHGEGQFDLAGTSVEVVPGSATKYVMLKAGAADLAGQQMTLEPQKYYSLAMGASGNVTLLVDQAAQNKAKATIEFFNLSDVPTLGLAVASGAPVIFEDVAAGASAARDVNPISVAFGVVQGGAVTVTIDEVGLERGNVYSVIATGTADEIRLAFLKNAVAAN